MALPTFINIGTYKCGTTWLFDMVVQHPEVFLPDFKELHYFSSIHGDGLLERFDIDWYKSVFEPGKDRKARGDISPGYLVEPAVAGRIKEHVPDAQLLCVFRNPIERVRTHYYYQQNGKIDLGYQFDDLINDPSIDREGRWNILNHGYYARNLKPFLERFDRDKFHFVLLDDIKARPDRTLSEVFEFIGVDPSFKPTGAHERSNAARALRSRRLYWLQYNVAKVLHRNNLDVVRRAIKATGLPDLMRRINTDEKPNPPLTSDQRAKLVDIYRDDVLELQDILGRNLSHWLSLEKPAKSAPSSKSNDGARA